MFELGAVFLLLSLLGGAVMYLILCIDPNNQGILGKLRKLVYETIPDALHKMIGGDDSRVYRYLNNFCNYMCYTNHPLVQFFYILVSPGGFCLYWYAGFSTHFDNNSQVSPAHKYIACVFSYFAFYSYYLACKHGPGEITKKNVSQFVKKYEKYYNGILYRKDNKCSTCDFPKPARSKHCSTCKMCVSKFDHHCIWIRQCVGEKNYKYFLSFLLIHACYTFYGCMIGLFCLYGVVVDTKLLEAKFRGPSGEIVDATWGIVLRYLFFKETFFVFMIILCAIMSIALYLFYFYHLTLVSAGVTTNEKIKRSDCMSFIKKKLKQVQKDVKEEQDEEKKKDMHKKIEDLISDYEILENWPTKGLFQNLKEIYQA